MPDVLTAARKVLDVLGECDHFDHHGYCQAHFVEKPCSVEELRQAVSRADDAPASSGIGPETTRGEQL